MKTDLLLSKDLDRFILIGMNYETCEPVLCICILVAKSLSDTYFKGLDYRASIPYDSSKTM